MSRTRSMTFLEALESRTLMSVDAGPLLVALPPLANNAYLQSEFGGTPQIQLAANEGLAEALSLQTTSSLDLMATEPSAGLGQQYVAQLSALPTPLPPSSPATPLDQAPVGD